LGGQRTRRALPYLVSVIAISAKAANYGLMLMLAAFQLGFFIGQTPITK
jgi:hypothetical protein